VKRTFISASRVAFVLLWPIRSLRYGTASGRVNLLAKEDLPVLRGRNETQSWRTKTGKGSAAGLQIVDEPVLPGATPYQDRECVPAPTLAPFRRRCPPGQKKPSAFGLKLPTGAVCSNLSSPSFRP